MFVTVSLILNIHVYYVVPKRDGYNVLSLKGNQK